MRHIKKIKPYHILVQHQYEAEDLLRLLAAGKSFEDLAKKYSICSSGPGGGFLGEVAPDRLHPDFLECFESLPAGQVSKPLRTPFGWHILKK